MTISGISLLPAISTQAHKFQAGQQLIAVKQRSVEKILQLARNFCKLELIDISKNNN